MKSLFFDDSTFHFRFKRKIRAWDRRAVLSKLHTFSLQAQHQLLPHFLTPWSEINPDFDEFKFNDHEFHITSRSFRHSDFHEQKITIFPISHRNFAYTYVQEIAGILRQHENKDEYLSVPTHYKCDWMQSNCPEAWTKTKIFFEIHGSRCVKEVHYTYSSAITFAFSAMINFVVFTDWPNDRNMVDGFRCNFRMHRFAHQIR